MDKSLNQNGLSAAFTKQLSAVSNTRYKFQDGGSVDPIDEEILQLERFVGLRPTNAMEAFWVEQMKDRLSYLYEVKKGKQ
ncbi:MAG: hypothetical protein MRY23_01970 [Pelagibacteraceae bacterium]|nr:hypothetical protein [Pelagibacteraceae bacterium]MCI5079645.1 hypothetical protein [Pelagibacteraceae bacterium]